jgi:hypothetical protein
VVLGWRGVVRRVDGRLAVPVGALCGLLAVGFWVLRNTTVGGWLAP